MTPRQRAFGGIVLASASLVATVIQFEGSEPVAYQDVVGVQTVCAGHTGPDIDPNKVYTAQECNAMLVHDLTKHGQGLLQCITVPINQNQYDAFTSFTFNVGVQGFCKSTLVKKLNAGDYTGACDQMTRWVYADGKKFQGLVNRRKKERELCLKPV